MKTWQLKNGICEKKLDEDVSAVCGRREPKHPNRTHTLAHSPKGRGTVRDVCVCLSLDVTVEPVHVCCVALCVCVLVSYYLSVRCFTRMFLCVHEFLLNT